MMILEVDIGNTRLKWRLRADAKTLFTEALVRDDYSSIDQLLLAVAGALSELQSSLMVDRVLVGSVATDEVAQVLARWSLDQYGIEAEFAYVTGCCAGVTVGYGEPARLGVDRWLAVLAASQERMDGVLIVDCGSAITVDVLHGDVHQGGYIVPGLKMMHHSLFANTAQVRAASSASVTREPGENTEAAVNNGLSLMVTGFLLAVVTDLSRAGWWALPGTHKVLVTGGDARRVVDMLSAAVEIKDYGIEIVDDLVLNGLDLVAKRHWS